MPYFKTIWARRFAGIKDMQNTDYAAILKSANGSHRLIIEGTTPMVCIFCKYTTYIEFDLDLHLYQNHRMDLVKLPIGRGSLDSRINYATEEGKRVRINVGSLNK